MNADPHPHPHPHSHSHAEVPSPAGLRFPTERDASVHSARRVSAAVMGVAMALWLLLAWGVASGGPVVGWDDALAAWMHANAGATWIAVFSGISQLHTLAPFVVATLLLGGWLWRRGERVWSWLLPVAMIGASCLNMALKEAFERQRPDHSGLAAALHSFSFPSGHAAHAGTFYGLMALLAWQLLRGQHLVWRCVGAGAMLAMAALVMAGRVVLGVHYLSDVIAGLLTALAWLGLLLMILAPAAARPFGTPR